jgi:2-haloacid dehalogenase
MLVAAHEDDLYAAAACGLQTAYVHRPLEFGKSKEGLFRKQVPSALPFQIVAQDFNDLARQLDC